jgi:hypothetical protein
MIYKIIMGHGMAVNIMSGEVEKNPQKQGYQAKGDKKPTS